MSGLDFQDPIVDMSENLPFFEGKKKVDKELLCSQCEGMFNQPKLLNCMHPFCLPCLKKLIPGPEEANNQNVPPADGTDNQDAANAPVEGQPPPAEGAPPPAPPPKKIIICPICKDRTEVEQNVESLPKQYIIQNIIEIIESDNAGGPKCGECIEKSDVVAYCTSCGVSMCDKCSKEHERLKRYQGHKIKPADTIPREKLLKGHKEYCAEHDGELKYFCKTCQKCICRDCPVSDAHKDHEYALIKDVLLAKKQEVDDLIKKGREASASIKDFLDISQQMLHNSGTEKDKSIDAIKKSFDKMLNMLTKQKDQLIKKVTNDHEAGKKSLEDANKKFQVLTKLLEYSQTALEMAQQVGNIEVMADLKKQLEQLFTALDVDQITPTPISLPPDAAATYEPPTTEVFGVITTPFQESKGNVKVEVQKKTTVVMEEHLKQIIETCQKAMDLFNQN